MAISKELKADLLLLGVAVVWGVAFVAQRAGMEHVGPLTFAFGRFIVATLAILPIWWLVERPQSLFGWTREDNHALAIGVLLLVGMLLQQIGLVYTTAARAGFITGLYVVVVPLLGLLVGNRTQWTTWLGCAVAICGLYFLAQVEDSTMLAGDYLMLASTLVWGAHVVYTGKMSIRMSAYRLVFLQFGFASLASFPLMVIFEDFQWQAISGAAVSILYVGVLSSAVAFWLQIVAMRDACPAHAALIMSFEAIFAALGGWLLLGEHLSANELIGCGLIFSAALLSQLKLLLNKKGQGEVLQHPAGIN